MIPTPSPDLTGRVADLFRQTAAAHHRAFSATDGADPEWPMWYAANLHERLAALTGRSLTLDEMADFFVQADKEHSALSPRPDWPAFYAERFLRRFT